MAIERRLREYLNWVTFGNFRFRLLCQKILCSSACFIGDLHLHYTVGQPLRHCSLMSLSHSLGRLCVWAAIEEIIDTTIMSICSFDILRALAISDHFIISRIKSVPNIHEPRHGLPAVYYTNAHFTAFTNTGYNSTQLILRYCIPYRHRDRRYRRY
jgi:hypothetical protein